MNSSLPAIHSDSDSLVPTQVLIDHLVRDFIFDKASALDGCEVELDGVCEHGSPSWFKALRMV